MTLIVFRHLPAVAELEEQLRLQSRGLLPDEEAEELPHLIDDASRELFGITANDTFYRALPDEVRAKYGPTEWEAHFASLGQYRRDANGEWRDFVSAVEQGTSPEAPAAYALGELRLALAMYRSAETKRWEKVW